MLRFESDWPIWMGFEVVEKTSHGWATFFGFADTDIIGSLYVADVAKFLS